MIQDSGERKEFETGAVRDIHEGKGRCDLMPLDVVSNLIYSGEISRIEDFRQKGDVECLYECLRIYGHKNFIKSPLMLLEVAKHFEEGAKKYGENNWQKGIPLHCYIDSAIRHYLKHISGRRDEHHDRAFVWNIMCAIWTYKKMPELDDFTVRKDKENAGRTVFRTGI